MVPGQSWLGNTKIRKILNKPLTLHYDSCVQDRDLEFFLLNSCPTFIALELNFCCKSLTNEILFCDHDHLTTP